MPAASFFIRYTVQCILGIYLFSLYKKVKSNFLLPIGLCYIASFTRNAIRRCEIKILCVLDTSIFNITSYILTCGNKLRSFEIIVLSETNDNGWGSLALVRSIYLKRNSSSGFRAISWIQRRMASGCLATNRHAFSWISNRSDAVA